MSPLGPIEAYALEHRRFHPDVQAILAPFFAPLGLAWRDVRVKVRTAQFGSLGIRGRPTAVGVFGSTIHCIPGVLDADSVIRGNTWSWTQPRGVALWAHEVYHVYQWRRWRLRFVASVVWGVLRSLMRGRFYDHQVIGIEVEATAFQRQVLAILHR